MMRRRPGPGGQTLLEYSILLMIIIAALMTMQTYMKRGFQGRWKQSVDEMGDQYDSNAFNSVVRQIINSESESRMFVVDRVLFNGDMGRVTLKEDSSRTIESRTGNSNMNQ